ncbi:MAG: hypothetical protein ACRC62_00530 [Microcoleus sp.]
MRKACPSNHQKKLFDYRVRSHLKINIAIALNTTICQFIYFDGEQRQKQYSLDRL